MPFKFRKNLIFWIVSIFLFGIGVFSAQAFDYYPMQVGNKWVYTPSYGDGKRVDKIVGTEEIGGVLTYVWKREESAPDNYHEKRWFGWDGDRALLFRIWSNMALNPAISFNPAQVLPDLKNPKVGDTVKYELNIPGVSIQVTSVVESLTQTVTVPAGAFANCMVIREVSEITVNGVVDYDYQETWYAPDIGPIIYRKYDEDWKTTIFSQELAGFSNSGLLQVDINTSQDVYNVGDSLNAFISIYNSGSCEAADIYIAVNLSSGQLYFYPTFSQTVAPVLKTPANICGSPFVSDYQLVTLPIGSGFPKGNHTWYAVLVRPGTNVIGTSNWLSFDSAPFTAK